MAIANCPTCRFEFSAAEPASGPQRCPACGLAFTPGAAPRSVRGAMPAGSPDAGNRAGSAAGGAAGGAAGPTGRDESLAPAAPRPLSTAQSYGLAVVILAVALADLAIAFAAATRLRADPVGAGLLVLAVAGHLVANVLAATALRTSPAWACRVLRAGLACWVGLGATGLIAGGRPWPADWDGQGLDMLYPIFFAAGTLLGLLLIYLRALEWLADRVEPPAALTMATGSPAAVLPATLLLAANAVLAVFLAVVSLGVYSQGDAGAAVLAAVAASALAVYAVLTGGALYRRRQPADPDSPKALGRAVGVLVVAVLLLLAGRSSRWLFLAVPLPALAAVLLGDALAVWLCHRSLVGPRT